MTNKSIAEKTGCNFIGCASHRFNLAVKDYLVHHSELIDKVSVIMKKLRSPVAAAKLRKLTHLRSLGCNQTRWSSSYVMLQRYINLCPHFDEAGMNDIEDYMLTPREHKISKNCALSWQTWIP